MTPTFFKKNRHRLGDAIEGGLAVLTAYTALQRSGDMAHRFEQEANFWYLTGIDEPDWWMILDGTADKCWLVAPDIDAVHRTFDGGLSPAEASTRSGIEKVLTQDDGEALLRQLAKKHTVVRTIGKDPHRSYYNFIENPTPKKLWAQLERTFQSVQDCRPELNRLRSIKQPEEIQALQRAVRLTTAAFADIRKQLPALQYEYEVEAEFDRLFKKENARHAYEPIIAGGGSACTLHYLKNDQRLQANRLILMDVGARVDGYAADISRTLVKGSPTKRQSAVHAAVARAHQAIINLLEPGLPVTEYHRKVDEIMTEALKSLDLYHAESDLRRYMPHSISHGLGIDPHDPLGAPKYFEANMVLTVEPGIYIPEESIGVRIEDDILITDKGRRNLSGSLSTGL
jgi:Xaa-Pro aminopeptidase